MTPDQVKLVQDSFAKVAPIADDGGRAVLRPPVRDRAASARDVPRRHDRAAQEADGDARHRGQRARTISTRILPAASALAKRHVGYGVQAGHYPVGRRGAAVDAGARARPGLDAGGRGGLDRRLHDAVGLHDQRSVRPEGRVNLLGLSPRRGREEKNTAATLRRTLGPQRCGASMVQRSSMSEPLVVIGNGMAAARFAEELSSRALGRYAVAVVGEEPRLAYNRVLLSSVLAGEVASSDIELKSVALVARSRRHAALRLPRDRDRSAGAHASRWRTAASLPFSKLVFATGSQPIRPPLPGMELPGVHHVPRPRRCLDHLASRRRGRPRGGHRRRAARPRSRLRPRQSRRARHGAAPDGPPDGAPARPARRRDAPARGRGQGHRGRAQRRDGGDQRARSRRGRRAQGRPHHRGRRRRGRRSASARMPIWRATPASRSKRGIVVDDGLETSVAGIHAIGECAEHRGVCYGLVEPAYEQARVLARRLAGARGALSRAACSRPI